MRRRTLVRLGWGGLCLAALAAGLGGMWRYDSTPGRAADPADAWPADSTLPPPDGHPSLLLFAHPHCPCTRASLEELAGVLASAPNVRAHVVFGVPTGHDDWRQTP